MARSFNGTSDRILTPNSAAISSGNKLTIMARVKATSWGSGAAGKRAITLGGGNVAWLGVSATAGKQGRFLLFITTTGNQTLDFGAGAGSAYTDGVWQAFGCSYDGAGDRVMRGYLDGIVSPDTLTVAGVNAIGWGAAGKASIGAQDGGGGNWWAGAEAEIAVWMDVLTAEQHMAFARGVSASRLGKKPDLYMPIWGKDSPEPDYSGNALNGTLTGTAQVDHPPTAPPFGFDEIWLPTAAVGGGTTPKQADDTGVGADAVSLVAAIPAPDTSGGIDAAALAAALSAADAALGNDSFSVVVPGAPTFSDLGAGTDAFSVSVKVSVAETGAATETTTLQFSPTLTETGAATDAISDTAALSASEAGVGSDTSLPPTAFIVIGETPLATDTGGITSVSYILGETGAGVDAFSRSQGLFLGTATGRGRIDPLSPHGRIESSLSGRIERPSRGSIERRTS